MNTASRRPLMCPINRVLNLPGLLYFRDNVTCRVSRNKAKLRTTAAREVDTVRAHQVGEPRWMGGWVP